MILRNARTRDGGFVDVDLGPSAAEANVEADGQLVLPALAEPHAHLDKVDTWDASRARPGGLDQAVGTWLAHAERVTEDDVRRRARARLLSMVARGVTAVRTHCDLLPGDALRSLRALLTLRAELAAWVDIQVVPLAYPGTPTDVLDEAMAAGADLVGGAPHLADDPQAELRRLLDTADRHRTGADLHTDENLDRPPTLEAFAREVAGRSTGAPFTASHCCRQATLAPADLDRTAEVLLDGGVSVVTLPQTNLYLQGRRAAGAAPRGVTPVRAWLDRGILVAAGGDNIRDPFNPLGRGDPLDTAAWLVAAAHLTPDEAFDAVSIAARSVLGLPSAGSAAGEVRDLLLVPSADVAQAVAAAPADRWVFRRGRAVARTRVTIDSELPGGGAA